MWSICTVAALQCCLAWINYPQPMTYDANLSQGCLPQGEVLLPKHTTHLIAMWGYSWLRKCNYCPWANESWHTYHPFNDLYMPMNEGRSSVLIDGQMQSQHTFLALSICYTTLTPSIQHQREVGEALHYFSCMHGYFEWPYVPIYNSLQKACKLSHPSWERLWHQPIKHNGRNALRYLVRISSETVASCWA